MTHIYSKGQVIDMPTSAQHLRALQERGTLDAGALILDPDNPYNLFTQQPAFDQLSESLPYIIQDGNGMVWCSDGMPEPNGLYGWTVPAGRVTRMVLREAGIGVSDNPNWTRAITTYQTVEQYEIQREAERGARSLSIRATTSWSLDGHTRETLKFNVDTELQLFLARKAMEGSSFITSYFAYDASGNRIEPSEVQDNVFKENFPKGYDSIHNCN